MSLRTRDIQFGRKFYVVEVDRDAMHIEMYDWIVDTFGPPELDDKGHRWFVMDVGEFWFHKQSDRDWLIMRWS